MKKQWVTLIELIIAIIVFGIGIIAVLHLITNNMNVVDTVKTQTIATSLAKEWIELTYQIRNTNLLVGNERDCAIPNTEDITLDTLCLNHFIDDNHDALLIELDPADTYTTTPIILASSLSGQRHQSRLYKHTTTTPTNLTGNRYNHDNSSGAIPTSFGRYMTFTGVTTNDWWLHTDLIALKSYVLYMRWATTWTILLETLIGNTES